MSAINSIAEVTAAKGKQPAYSPFEQFWTRFLEWRKRKRLHTQLCDLSDKELADIGITRGEIDNVAFHQDIDPRNVLLLLTVADIRPTATEPPRRP